MKVAVKGEFPSEVLAKGRAKTKGEKIACSAPAEARDEPGGRDDTGITLLFGAGCASLPAIVTNRSPALHPDPRCAV